MTNYFISFSKLKILIFFRYYDDKLINPSNIFLARWTNNLHNKKQSFSLYATVFNSIPNLQIRMSDQLSIDQNCPSLVNRVFFITNFILCILLNTLFVRLIKNHSNNFILPYKTVLLFSAVIDMITGTLMILTITVSLIYWYNLFIFINFREFMSPKKIDLC